jgi:Alpha/beta hydrolase family
LTAERLPGDGLDSLPRVWVYGVVAAGVVVASLLKVLPRWPGLAHEVALPPLDLFADVRVLMARASSLPLFALGVVVAIVVRAALLAAVLGFTRRRFTFALRFYIAAVAPAVLASGLDFAGRAVLYAYLIWGGLLIALVAFVVLGAAPWVGRDTLHRALGTAIRRRFRLAMIAGYLVALAVVGDLWRRPGAASQVIIVPLSALLTAFAVQRLAAPATRPSLRTIAIAAAAVVVAVAFAVPRMRSSHTHAIITAQTGSLLLVPGVDTSTGAGAMFKLDPRAYGFSCAQTFYYSYRGPGAGGPQGGARCPIRTGSPYERSDTTRPLAQLASALRAQLVGLPSPVVVVTHSQGAWIAWSAITGGHETTARVLVMLAPFDQGLAPYPPPNTNRTGAAGGAAVRVMTGLGRRLGFSKFDPDAPLARELQGTPRAVERLVAQPLPSTVRGAAVIARGDMPLEPRRWPNALPEACPGWLMHAALPTSSVVAITVDRFLAGESLATCPRWVATIGHASDAFGAPPPDASN